MRKVLYIMGQLSDEDIEWLVANGRREAVSPGTTLIHEGRPVGAVYIVLNGLLSVFTARAGMQELARLGAGEIVGEMSFVDARPPSASVGALGDALVLSIPRSRLAAKLEQDVGFAARFYRAVAIFLSDRLRTTTSRLGYGTAQAPLDEAADDDQLDDNVLDNVHLAGARFQRILQRFVASGEPSDL